MLVKLLNSVIGIAIGFSTGANDAANAMGSAVGAGVRTVRQAIVLVAVFGILGAIFQGEKVITTVGSSIVNLSDVTRPAGSAITTIAYISAAIWVLITTYRGLPTSTSHSIIGGLIGASLAIEHSIINWKTVALLVCAWILTPVISFVLAFSIGQMLRIFRGREKKYRTYWNCLLTMSGIYMAYSWGASDVANATGPMVGSGVLNIREAVIIGSMSMASGVLLWGHRVMRTVGREITPLVPSQAFASEMSAALCVHICATFGFPASTSHAIVGAITGIGYARSRKTISRNTIQNIVGFWASTPFVTLLISYLLTSIAKYIVETY